jgi:hypothetical protein
LEVEGAILSLGEDRLDRLQPPGVAGPPPDALVELLQEEPVALSDSWMSLLSMEALRMGALRPVVESGPPGEEAAACESGDGGPV